MFKIFVFILIFLCLLCFVLFAQNEAIKFLSSVDKSELSADEALTLKVTVEGSISGNPKIELPELTQDFFIIATSQSQEIVFKAGKSSTIYLSNITLMPKRPGEITLPAAKLKVDSKVYTTEPIKIIVKPGKPFKELPPENPEDNTDREQMTL